MNRKKALFCLILTMLICQFSGRSLLAGGRKGQGASLPPASRPDSVEPKLPHHMRIAALQCNFEGGDANTLRVADLWHDYGFNVEQLFHTHCEMYSAVFNKDQHGKILKAYLEKTQSNDVAVILYMNSHILLDSQKDMWPQWAQVNKNGDYTVLYGTYKACCVNSAWTDYFLEAIRSLRDFDIAGIFQDGPVCNPCFCKGCREKYQQLYKASLMEATPGAIDEFMMLSKIDFLGKVYRTVKQTNLQWLIYNNLGLLHSNASSVQMRQMLDYNDIIGTEGGFQFYDSPKTMAIWRCGVNAKMVESTAEAKRKVLFTAADHKPWSWYLHTPAETKLCYASTLANGCSVWYGLHGGTELLSSPAGPAVKTMLEFDRANGGLYEQTQSIADVAVFYSFDTAKRYNSSGEKTDLYQSQGQKAGRGIGNYTESFYGAYDALFQSGIAFDVVTELSLDRLGQYSVLVVPTGACMHAQTAAKITEYVKNGGVLISDSETSLYDEEFTKKSDFQLSDVLGVSFKGYSKYQPHDYFRVLDSSYLDGQTINYIPAPLAAVDVDVADKAQVKAELFASLPGRYAGKPQHPQRPLIVKNTAGKGVSYYFAGTFFELFRNYGIPHYRKIINHLVKSHARSVVELVNAPTAVEVTVRKIGDTDNIAVHLVNYTGAMTRPIEQVVPLADVRLKLRVNPKRAKSLTSGKILAITENHEIVIDRLEEFEVIVLEL